MKTTNGSTAFDFVCVMFSVMFHTGPSIDMFFRHPLVKQGREIYQNTSTQVSADKVVCRSEH